LARKHRTQMNSTRSPSVAIDQPAGIPRAGHFSIEPHREHVRVIIPPRFGTGLSVRSGVAERYERLCDE
jgi:hypothetical protein